VLTPVSHSSRLVFVALLVLCACAVPGEDDDKGANDDDGDDDGSSGALSCAGTAYMRTDDPGTAMCLDGANTFVCSWGSGSSTVDGTFVDGNHDAAANRLTLCFPDDASLQTCTDFEFATLWDAGADLVLDYMGTRSGDYQQVGSWAEATAGDGGICSGGTSSDDGDADDGVVDDGGVGACGAVEQQLAGGWITPEGSTEASDSCNRLEFFAGGSGHLFMYSFGATMELDFGWRIEGDCDEIHYDYGTGWLADYSVIHRLDATKLDLEATDGSYYGERTVYDRLGGGGTPTDGTCGSACVDATGCDAGQACLNGENGLVCLPPSCETCWAEGRSCSWSGVDCGFVECGEQDPNFSETCQQPCRSDVDCNAGEACLDSASGNVCLPPSCQGCWDGGQTCYSNSATCVFDMCG
jgi:hypothetical protein